MIRFATIASALFHPLAMPLACVFVAYQFDWFVYGIMSEAQIRLVYLVIALSTIAFPGINILLLRWYGVVNSLEMPKRTERFAPFISTVLFFSLGYFLLRKGMLPDTIYSIMIGCILALVALTLINLRWKISAHAAGIFGVLGTVVALFQLHNFGNIGLLAFLILVGGTIITSRLALQAHTPAQAYTGAAVGFLVLYTTVSSGFFI